MLIAIEGIDGAGKTTLARKLKEWLESKGHEVEVIKEPGDSEWGRKIRESYDRELDAREELELFLKDREENVRSKILPALRREAIVIMDRYYYSTMAYQGARGIDVEEIRRRNEEIAPKPDVVLLLDCEPEVCVERIKKRGKANRFERLEYLKKVREKFLEVAEKDERVRVIDASRGFEEVFEEAKAIVEELLCTEV